MRPFALAAILSLATPAVAAQPPKAPPPKAAPPKAPKAPKAHKPVAEDPVDPKAPPSWESLGPARRKPTAAKEKDAKAGVDALYADLKKALEKGDAAAYAALCDFPLLLVSDDAAGQATLTSLDKDAFLKLMTPAMQPLGDAVVTSKHTLKLLSDALGTVDEDVSVKVGKLSARWKNTATVAKGPSGWRFKGMTEAGWGELLSGAAPGPVVPPATPAPVPDAPPEKPEKPK
jgi:hypothetical protein